VAGYKESILSWLHVQQDYISPHL